MASWDIKKVSLRTTAVLEFNLKKKRNIKPIPQFLLNFFIYQRPSYIKNSKNLYAKLPVFY